MPCPQGFGGTSNLFELSHMLPAGTRIWQEHVFPDRYPHQLCSRPSGYHPSVWRVSRTGCKPQRPSLPEVSDPLDQFLSSERVAYRQIRCSHTLPVRSPASEKAPTSVESLRHAPADIEESRRFLDVLADRRHLLVVLFQFPVSLKFTPKDNEREPVRLEGTGVGEYRRGTRSFPARHRARDRAARISATPWAQLQELVQLEKPR
jgi:hypothetical protein